MHKTNHVFTLAQFKHIVMARAPWPADGDTAGYAVYRQIKVKGQRFKYSLQFWMNGEIT